MASATIAINGRTVVGPDAFSMVVPFICVPVDNLLAGENELTVELRSGPGSFLTLHVVHTVPSIDLTGLDLSSVAAATCVARPVGMAVGSDGLLRPNDLASRCDLAW